MGDAGRAKPRCRQGPQMKVLPRGQSQVRGCIFNSSGRALMQDDGGGSSDDGDGDVITVMK